MRSCILSKPVRCTSLLLLLAMSFLFFACATQGNSNGAQAQAFVAESIIPEGQALVYFYRPYKFESSAVTPLIFTNQVNKTVGAIGVGLYFPYITNPSILKFWTYSDRFGQGNVTTIEAVAGETYYIKMEFLRVLKLIPAAAAKTEINSCKLSQ